MMANSRTKLWCERVLIRAGHPASMLAIYPLRC